MQIPFPEQNKPVFPVATPGAEFDLPGEMIHTLVNHSVSLGEQVLHLTVHVLLFSVRSPCPPIFGDQPDVSVPEAPMDCLMFDPEPHSLLVGVPCGLYVPFI